MFKQTFVAIPKRQIHCDMVAMKASKAMKSMKSAKRSVVAMKMAPSSKKVWKKLQKKPVLIVCCVEKEKDEIP